VLDPVTDATLLGAVVLSGALQVGGVLLAPLRTLLGTQPLTLRELLACAAVAAILGLALRLIRR
jgi:Ca2+-transporting ATPase